MTAPTHAQISDAVSAALRDLTPLLPPGAALPDGADAALVEADGGPLDSLGIVNFMVGVEGAVHSELGVSVSLAEALAEPLESSPFRTRAAMEAHLARLLGAEAQDTESPTHT